MKKPLAILLLLSLVVGCGESEQASESPPQEPQAPTLADSLQGKRIHFQIQEESLELWLQLGDNNQVTIDNGDQETMSYAINETKLIVDRGTNAGKLEIRFSKPDLAVADQVIFFADERTLVGSITKIEAAGRIKEVVNPENDPQAKPNAEPDPGDPTPPGDE